MLKIRILFLVSIFALALSACGSGNTESTENTVPQEEVQEVQKLDSVSAEITNEAQELENSADQILEELNQENQ